MIYTKEANFPYPLLVNHTDDYLEAQFDLEVTPHVNQKEYIFTIAAKLSSPFLEQCLKEGKAKLILVIKSKDNQFFDVSFQKELRIPKTRLSLDQRSTLQLMLRSEKELSFAENDDLNDFYTAFRQEILIPAGQALGFSNTVTYTGEQKNPFDIFEKRLDENQKSAIKIVLKEDVIVLSYKSREMQFGDFSPHESRNLNNPFLYIGLSKALTDFVMVHEQEAGEGVDIANMVDSESLTNLHRKLLVLMQEKRVDDLSLERLDEVIDLISDHILEKYVATVRGLK